MGMSPVWCLYNFMQMVSNIMLMQSLLLPSNSRLLLEVLFDVSFFNLMKHPIIVKYKEILIKEYALEFLGYIYELTMLSVAMGFAIGLGFAVKKYATKDKIHKAID
jgi:hypothetical protein